MKCDLYVYLFPALETTDVTTKQFKFGVIMVTFVIYTSLFFVVYLVSKTSVRFNSLHSADRFTWCVRLTKELYFPIPVFTGLWYLLVDDTLRNDIANGISKSSYIALYMHIGYNILDCILVAVGKILFGRLFSTALFIHHFLVLTGYSIGFYYIDKAHYFALLGFIYEMSGPFSYLSWILGKAKATHLSIWKISQQISVYLLHFRTLLDFYIFYILIKNWEQAWTGIPLPLLVSYFTSVIIVFAGLTPHLTQLEAKRLYKTNSKKSIEFILQQMKDENNDLEYDNKK